MVRYLIGEHIVEIDRLCHKRLKRFTPGIVCHMLDIVHGWGPDCSDWEQSSRLTKWLYEWYWKYECSKCYGRGEIAWWQKGDPDMQTDDDWPRREKCEECNGTGKRQKL